MKKSESITKLSVALVKAQAEMQGAKKGKSNPFFKSKYADLVAVMEATKEALHNNGLAIVQFPIAGDKMCGVETMMIHESGEYIGHECLLACSKQDPQAYGSAITYARRYSWQAICGIPSEDDDGNHATHGNKPQNNDELFNLYDNAWGLFESKKEALTEEQRNWCIKMLNQKTTESLNAVINGIKGV